MTNLTDVVWSHSGFDDLKKYSHKNNEFIRDVAQLFQERMKLEQIYADGLTKIATKARKMMGDTLGTLRQSWEDLASITDQEANLHKNFGHELLESVSKPFRIFADQQKETRKPAEQAVDKALKILSDKRTKESASKKNAYLKAKEAENLTLQLETSRGKALTEKELSKLDSKCKKAEESVNKSDEDYVVKLIEGERARLNLDSSITASTLVMQNLEEERVAQFKKFLSLYSKMLLDSIPQFDEIYKTLEGQVNQIDVDSDLNTLIQTRGTKRQPGEQILFTCFEEDLNNTMEETRRRLALESKIKKVERQLFAERKARKGLSRLNSVYTDNPSFSDQSTQQDVGFQLLHANSVINLLEVSVFRLNEAISKVGHYTPTHHQLSKYIEERKDKQGIIVATLRVPLESEPIYNEDNDDYMPASEYTPSEYNMGSEYRSSINTSYDNHYMDDDDDFDDVDPDFEDLTGSNNQDYEAVDQCMADYEYTATEKDELSILPGDTITVILRHDDGWWKGELNGKIGLFPSSYVHEL